VAGYKFYAKAKSNGESSCLESNSVLVPSCASRSAISSLALTCASDRGFDGTAPANAVVRIYVVTANGYTLYADESTTLYKIARPGATTRWTYDSINTNSANPCTGGQADVTIRQYAITIQEPGKCESDYHYVFNNNSNTCTSTTATPTITQTTLYTGGTTISGTATANATVRLFKDGGLRATTTASATGAYSFTGLSLNLGEVFDVYAHSSGSCISAKTTRTVTCFTTTPVITTDNAGNLTAGATSIKGTSSEATGTTIRIYNGSNTLLATTTVQSGGTWSAAVTVASGTSYYAIAQNGTCNVSTQTASVSALSANATTRCGSITGPVAETATSVSGTLSGTAVAGTTVRLVSGGVTINSVTTGTNTWTIPVNTTTTNTISPGDTLRIEVQESGRLSEACTPYVVVSCVPPSNPTVSPTMVTVSASNGRTVFSITGSQSGVLYTLEDLTGIDRGVSVFGNGGTVMVTSYAFLTPGTYSLRMSALKFTGTCGTGTTSITLVVTDNDADGVPDVTDLDDDNDGILDTNETTTYDATGDADSDGIPNYKDTTPGTGLPATDSNGDGIIDYYDTDRDGIINQFDVDSDNDGIPDIIENGGTDSDNDGKVDGTADVDADGLRDAADANTSGASGSNGLTVLDFDGDGVPNFRDLDADGDGVLDSRESGLGYDTNNNGLLSDDAGYVGGTDGWSDAVDALAGPLSLRNTDGRGKPDYLDIDNDDDGIVDNIEARATTSTLVPTGTDTDGDGIDNAYDNVSTAGTFGGNASNGITPVNTDGDSQPDYRDTDSDNDGFPDAFEGHDTDGDNLPNANTLTKNGVGGTADIDGDGLLDGYDNNTAAVNPLNGTVSIPSPAGTNYPNIDKSSTTERDWREANDADSDGIMDTLDLDDDNDGIPDIVECGGVSPTDDADSDGLLNYLDPTPGTGVPAFVDVNGDGISDVFDADRDGILNSLDLDSDNDGIPDVVEAGGVDANGDGRIDNFSDTDNDGLSQNVDANNTGSANSGNGLGLVDTDGDGVLNFIDLDSDNDGIPDVVESSGVDANGDGRMDNYADSDGDGFDSRVDGDANGDGIAENAVNALVLTGADVNNDGKADSYPQGFANTDGGGKPNAYDLDSDNDGIPDLIEAGGTDSDNNGKVDVFADTDGDGYADARDGDVGNDGTSENLSNVLIATGTDANNDGKADSYSKANADGRNLPNPYDLDSDDDGIPDLIESGGVDSNGDGMVDNTTDANSNGWPDAYEPAQSGINLKTLDANGNSAGGAVFDFDGDGIANYLDLDSDNDGIPDILEQGGTDSNNDGKVDIVTDIDKDGFSDTHDPVNNSTGAALGTALITTGSTRNAQNLPAAYSAGDDFDGKGLINMLDLDSDDDGIADVREAGFTAYDSNNSSIINSSDAGYADANSDGWSDAIDALAGPLTLPNTDGDSGKPNYLDLDSDNDGIPDNIEARTTTSLAAPLNSDSDADGLDDQYDALLGVGGAALTPVNTDGDVAPDYTDMDSDNDGIMDRIEGWDSNGDNRINGSETAYVGTSDSDGDGLLDEYDNNDAAFNPTNGTTGLSYPNVDNPATQERDWREAADTDKDGIPDNIDVDMDNDGIPNTVESGGVNPFGDADGDGIPNYLDPTPGTGPAFIDSNNDGVNDNYDADLDGIINALDLDSDGDGIPDLVEAGGIDTNGDGRVDYTGTFAANDSDNDGLINIYDVSTGGIALGSLDSDGDGVLNIFDLDSDNDGIPDVVEAGSVDANNDGRYDATTDSDGDGWADAVDGDVGNDGLPDNSNNVLIITGADTNGDGKPDSYVKGDFDHDSKANPYDLDSDGDGILDIWEANFHQFDTNGNGYISSSDAGYADANGDGWSDAIDALASLNLPNTDATGRADWLDIDADDDGITDNVEGQSTASYTAPSGNDSDGDGIDDSYDNLNGFGGSGIIPVNTDGADLPDYRDTDSDNDNDPDKIEGNDLNKNHQADDVPGTVPATDTDGDGLLDFLETDINNGPVVTIAGFGGTGTSGKSTAQKTLATATDRDWRNSAFTLSGHVILPVTFLNVKAAMQGAAVAVSWSVSDEHNVLHYRVERSTDGSAFTQVGIVAYKAPTGSVNEYQFVDRGATGQRVQYRVRQVDTDGSVTLSPVVSIQRAAGETKLVLYPNPVQAASVVELTAMVAQQVQLVLTDVQGNRLMQQMVPVQKGRTVVNTLALQQLPSGMYLLSGVIDGRLCSMSFIKP
jgi:hypothetical protein